MNEGIVFAVEPNLSRDEFRDVLVRSTLGERRPVDEPVRLQTMLSQADVIITARAAGVLIGISRAITDFSFCCYLSDLAVDQSWQGRGIGRALIEATHREAGFATTLYLVSAPAAESYYPHIGMMHVSSCWKCPASK